MSLWFAGHTSRFGGFVCPGFIEWGVSRVVGQPFKKVRVGMPDICDVLLSQSVTLLTIRTNKNLTGLKPGWRKFLNLPAIRTSNRS
jgi:hypothetical protein